MPDQLQPIHVGHEDIGNHDIELGRVQRALGIEAGGRGDHQMPGAFQRVARQGQRCQIVVDQKNKLVHDRLQEYGH